MPEPKSLIEWKTNAWKHPEMVAWYNQRMHEETGLNLLKNAVEVSLCAQLAVKSDLLDVGIGTGRASRPLAAQGFSVTGVDSSKAMLQQCARLAGKLRLNLQEADVTELPFPDRRFDTVMGLNVMIHFPHTAEILGEWQRVTKPGGRIFFDLLSKDHYCTAKHLDEPQADSILNGVEAIDYCRYLSSHDILQIADTLGLRIAGVLPYGAFFETNHWWHDTLGASHSWRRLLSHLRTDRALLDFVAFMELELVTALPPWAAPRIMVAFDNEPDPDANAAWSQRCHALTEIMAHGVNLENLAAWSRQFNEVWRNRFNVHLEAPRSRVLFHRLLRTLRPRLPTLDLNGLLDEELRNQFVLWSAQDVAERDMVQFCESWHGALGDGNVLSASGIALADCFEYELMRRLVQLHSISS
jgi:2-polyprenyl-3-methyl-5-hydroxy-6-metoxy-1,4-benzoquinol methylase